MQHLSQRCQRTVTLDGQQGCPAEERDELIRIFWPNGIIIIGGKAAHAVGEGDELVVVDVLPITQQLSALFDRCCELHIS